MSRSAAALCISRANRARIQGDRRVGEAASSHRQRRCLFPGRKRDRSTSRQAKAAVLAHTHGKGRGRRRQRVLCQRRSIDVKISHKHN